MAKLKPASLLAGSETAWLGPLQQPEIWKGGD